MMQPDSVPTAAELRRRFPGIPADASDDEIVRRYKAHLSKQAADAALAPPSGMKAASAPEAAPSRPVSFRDVLAPAIKPAVAPASSTLVEPQAPQPAMPNPVVKFATDVAKNIGGQVKEAVTHPVRTVEGVAKATAEGAAAPITVTTRAVQMLMGKSPAAILRKLPQVDTAALRARGYDEERIQHLLDERERVANSLIEDINAESAKVREQTANGVAFYLSLLTGGAASGALKAAPALARAAGAGAAGMGTFSGAEAAGMGASPRETAVQAAAGALLGAGLGVGGHAIAGKITNGRGVPAAEAPAPAPVEAPVPSPAAPAAIEVPTAEAMPAVAPRAVGFSDALSAQIRARGVDPVKFWDSLRKDKSDAYFRDNAPKFEREELAGLEQIARTEVVAPSVAAAPEAPPAAVEQGPSLATPMQRQPIPQGAMLPRELAGAKPRFKGSPLQFESDIDRAAYIVAQAKKSARDADYRKFLRAQGLTNLEIAARGRTVKATIARAAAEAAPNEALSVPSHEPVAPAVPGAPVEGTPTEATRVAREPGVFAPTSRAGTVPEAHQGVVRKIEASPTYLDKLSESGGGRRITNAETWKKAVKASPMTLEELGTWKPGDRVNEIDVARARIFRQASLDEHQAALASGDLDALDRATNKLLDVEAGFNNLTATPARALQMEGAQMPGVEDRLAVSNYQREYSAAVRELRAANIPYDQFANKLEEIKRKHAAVTASNNDAIRGVTNSLETWATAAKLTSPVTHAINTISNTLTHVLQRGPEKNLASWIVGKNTPEGQALAKNALWASSQGFKDATRIALEEAKLRWEGKLNRTIPTEDPQIRKLQAAIKQMQDAGADEGSIQAMNEELVNLQTSKAEVAARPLPLHAEKVFTALDAADTYWKTIIYHSEINQRALAQALSEGLKDEGLAARTTWLMEHAPETWVEEAWTKAKEFTFQEDSDKFLKALQGVQRLPGGRVVFAAFLKTPYNIIRFAVRRSPLGLFSKGLREDLAAGGVRRAEGLARVGLGTAASLGMVGLVWSNSDNFTAAYPKDKNERALWEAEGRKPWSMKLGDRWINYSRLGPISAQMMMAAGYVQALKDGKKDEAAAFYIRLFQQYSRGPLELPMMQSTAALVDALEDPEHFGEKWVQGMATGFVPGVVRDVRQQVDTTRRKPEGVGQAIEDMLPGASGQVPARRDVLGREAKLEPNPLLRATKLVSQSTADEITKAMRETGYVPPTPSSTLTFKDNKVKLEGKQKEEFLRDMGSVTEVAMRFVMLMPGYKDWSNEERAKRFDQVVSKRQESMRKLWRSHAGVLGANRVVDPKTFALRRDALLKIRKTSAQMFAGLEPDEVVAIAARLRALYPAIPASATDDEVLRRHKEFAGPDLSDESYATKAKATYLIEGTQ